MSQYVLLTPSTKYYIAHHGIKGQQWGVLHGPPYPLKRTVSGKIQSQAKTVDKRSSDPHNKKGNKSELAVWMTKAGIDLLTLNPIGAVSDIARIGGAASAAIGEKAAEKRLKNAAIDSKTGLGLKVKVLTPEQDMRLTNPGYHNFNSNTKNNCVLCSTAFELRRRGYDVIAAKAGRGYNESEYDKWWKGSKTHFRSDEFPTERFGIPNPHKSQKLVDWANENILKQGEGARGSLSISFDGFSGHSLAYEVKNGTVQVYDAQCGKKFSLKQVASMSTDIGYSRLDDKQPDLKEMRKSGVIP